MVLKIRYEMLKTEILNFLKDKNVPVQTYLVIESSFRDYSNHLSLMEDYENEKQQKQKEKQQIKK